MKRAITILLAITSPIWIFPIAFIVIIGAGIYDMYKNLDKLLWGKE